MDGLLVSAFLLPIFNQPGVDERSPGELTAVCPICKDEQLRFALFPEFLIPFRSFSREAFLRIWEVWRSKPKALAHSVDLWFHAFDREVYLSTSTLYSQLRLILRQLRAGHTILGTPPVSVACVNSLLLYSSTSIDQAIRHPAFGVLASLRIDPPP